MAKGGGEELVESIVGVGDEGWETIIDEESMVVVWWSSSVCFYVELYSAYTKYKI